MITREQAIAIARAQALAAGWAFSNPIGVIERKGWFGGVLRFEIETSAGYLGTKARFVIDAATGEVLSAGYVGR